MDSVSFLQQELDQLSKEITTLSNRWCNLRIKLYELEKLQENNLQKKDDQV